VGASDVAWAVKTTSATGTHWSIAAFDSGEGLGHVAPEAVERHAEVSKVKFVSLNKFNGCVKTRDLSQAEVFDPRKNRFEWN
jgi:hypothetical protein